MAKSKRAATSQTEGSTAVNTMRVRELILLGLDAIVPPNNNVNKCCNKDIAAMDELGVLERKPGEPWIAVSVPPMREWDQVNGGMPVDLLMETDANKVDTSFNGEVLLVGEGYNEHVTLTNGRLHLEVKLVSAASPNDPFVSTLYAFDVASKAQGQSPSFTTTPA